LPLTAPIKRVGDGPQIGKAERLAEAANGGPPLTKHEGNPTNILHTLLVAANPKLDVKGFWHDVRPEHVAIAGREYMRQATIAALGRHQGSA
jgi:hypothetical protein